MSNEEVREDRQAARDRKADRYEAWARRRRQLAEAVIAANRSYTDDIAFNTQPGHIPLRNRIIRQNDRAFESLKKAKEMEHRAQWLRRTPVAVAGDADRRRQDAKDHVLDWIKVGMEVDTAFYGRGTVVRVNRKTARIANCGVSKTYVVAVPLEHIVQIE
jgi:hypothetical protein